MNLIDKKKIDINKMEFDARTSFKQVYEAIKWNTGEVVPADELFFYDVVTTLDNNFSCVRFKRGDKLLLFPVNLLEVRVVEKDVIPEHYIVGEYIVHGALIKWVECTKNTPETALKLSELLGSVSFLNVNLVQSCIGESFQEFLRFFDVREHGVDCFDYIAERIKIMENYEDPRAEYNNTLMELIRLKRRFSSNQPKSESIRGAKLREIFSNTINLCEVN